MFSILPFRFAVGPPCYEAGRRNERTDEGARRAPTRSGEDARGTGEGKGDRAGGLLHREGLRQGFHHAPRQRGGDGEGRGGDLDGVHLPRHRAGRRRPPARTHHRDLRPGVVGQDHAGAPRGGRGPEEGGHRRLRRRRARARRGLRPQAGRPHRRSAHLPARHRRAGARDHRDAGPLRRHRRAGHRLGGGARSPRRARGRDGRRPHGPAGAPHEPGAAQAHRHHLQVVHHRHLHQPDPHEDRRDVRQPGDHHRRQRAQVLRHASGSTSGASAPSRTARRSSATAPA